jgi:hypothetical protein
MQHHAVRRRPRLFVADIGVAQEMDTVIDGSPPVRTVPNQFATGFAAPLYCSVQRLFMLYQDLYSDDGEGPL